MYLARAVDQSWNPQWQRLGLTTHLAPGDADLPARLASAGPPAARRFISATALTLPALPRGKWTARRAPELPSCGNQQVTGPYLCTDLCTRPGGSVGTRKTAKVATDARQPSTKVSEATETGQDARDARRTAHNPATCNQLQL